MPIVKINDFLKNRENILLLLFCLFALLASLSFVGKEVEQLEAFAIESKVVPSFIFFFIVFFISGTLFYIFRKPVDLFSLSGKLILVLLPSAVIWFYGFSESIRFNNFQRLSGALYILLSSFYVILKYNQKRSLLKSKDDLENSQDQNQKTIFNDKFKRLSKIPVLGVIGRWTYSQGITAIVILIAVLTLNLGLGLSDISKFAAVDEPLWTYDRIPKFWKNIIGDQEFHKTRVSDKPGITVAILSGIGLTQVNPATYKNPGWENEIASDYNNIETMNFFMRFPIFLFDSLMLLVFYGLLKKLLGKETALFSVIFIGLSPILLGISSIINPDSLLWVFTSLSIISYFIYLKNTGMKYLYLSGFFMGLSILTKYVANFLYIFYFGLIFLEYILNKEKYQTVGISQYFKRCFGDYLILVFFSLLTFFALLPAAWVNPLLVFEGTIFSKAFTKIWPLFIAIIALVAIDTRFLKNKLTIPVLNFIAEFKTLIIRTVSAVFAILITATLANTYSGMKFFNFESILASPKSSYAFNGFISLILANVYSLIFGIIPIALLAIIFLSLKITTQKPNEKTVWSFYIILFILLYYLASTINDVSATVRYQIIIYPLALILAAIGIYEFLQIERVKKYFLDSFAFLALLIFSVFSLYSIKPFYFSYASDLLPRQYVLNLKDMGDGSYEAAQFLNSLPHPENIRVWTDKRGVCVFFLGRCNSGFDFAANAKDVPFDYFVVSAGRESRTTRMILARYNGGNSQILRVDKLYTEKDEIYKLEIGGRPNNFIKVISLDQLLD